MTYHLSLGSNLGRKRRNLARAIGALEAAGARLSRASSVYRTEPVGILAQPWFYNQVIEIVTALGPHELLRLIGKIEKDMGRVRGPKKGPRLIDIDILLAGPLIIRTPRLTIPHPGLEARNFVLVPLAEIAPAAVHPVLGKTSAALLAASGDRSVVRKLRPLRKEQR